MLKIGFLATRRFRSVPGAVIDQDLFRAIDWQLSHSGDVIGRSLRRRRRIFEGIGSVLRDRR